MDLFFDYEKGKLGLFELMDVKEQTSRILGRKADIDRVLTTRSVHKNGSRLYVDLSFGLVKDAAGVVWVGRPAPAPLTPRSPQASRG